VVWDLGGTQTAAYCQQAGRKVQKLKSFLAEIGGALDASFEEGKKGLYFTEDDINDIISQLLQDIMR
jgi:hypothetical protein